MKRYSHDGVLKATIQPGYRPNGLSVDGEGKVWVVDWDDEYIHRINPAINGVDLSKRIVGGRHYTTSSMTGTNTISNYFKEGSWTIIHDTNQINTPWGMISWTGTEPTGTTIRVRARSSNDQTNWSSWEDATNNTPLHLTPAGRYLQVMVTLTTTVKNVSPVLNDLTVTPLSEAPINNTDLSLSILSDTYTPSVNSTIRIVLDAGNNGPNDASNVQVNYRLPFGLEYQSTNGNYDPSTGLWTVGNIASGTTTTLEIIARIINSGSLVNTGTIIGTDFDPNAANNHASLTLSIPNPAAEEELPEVLPNLPNNGEPTLPSIPDIEDLIDLDPGIPLSFNPGSGNTGSSNGPGSGPGTLGGNDQLYRDQMYVRGVLSPQTNLRPNDDTNKTTQKPEMPGWDIDTSLIPEILIATAMIATSAVAARFLKGETDEIKNKFETWAVKNLGPRKPTLMDFILFGVSAGMFYLDPTLLDGIMIFLTFCGVFFNSILNIMLSGTMQIFSYFILAVGVIKLVKKYLGLDVVQMASDKLGKFKEIVINIFKSILRIE